MMIIYDGLFSSFFFSRLGTGGYDIPLSSHFFYLYLLFDSMLCIIRRWLGGSFASLLVWGCQAGSSLASLYFLDRMMCI